MIASLVLTAAALATPSQAAPGDWVTLGVRAAPGRKLVRVYLVPEGSARNLRSALDPRLHYIGSGRARNGSVTVSFLVPPLTGRYRAWCAGCSAGGALNVVLPATTAESCPVTIPQSWPPPGLTGVWHGNDALWTHLPDDGVLRARPQDVRADGSVWTKKFWYAAGVDGELSLSGRRLDAAAPPLVVHQVNRGTQSNFRGSGTWATPITFAASGCWRLTARVATSSYAVSLSFVMKVVVG